jgi:beta-1,4-mannosyl-glycoprotein beta-1,4-N-acetylglucosaminyltransferase
MPKLHDCFLYHDETELLEIRLKLLSDHVDQFTIVCSKETFTGKPKQVSFPIDNPVVVSLRDKIRLVELDCLEGKTAWDRESFQRDQMSLGAEGLSDQDLVMFSDVDEIPRPASIERLKRDTDWTQKVLELDYYNFKFNYKMFVGVQAAWAGPTVARMSHFTSPQEMRDKRWQMMLNAETSVPSAGWHFSFITASGDVSDKLSSFSHQEKETQSRTSDVSELLVQRSGFHDHIHPGAVWGFVALDDYRCDELSKLIAAYPSLSESKVVDDPLVIEARVKKAIRSVCFEERGKVLSLCSVKELLSPLLAKLTNWSS